MSQFTVEVLDSEIDNFVKELSKLPYVSFIYNNEKEVILKSIEIGLNEVKDIISGKQKALSEKEFFAELEK